MNNHNSAPGEAPARDRRGSYTAALVIEAITILALWLFQAHFS